MNHPSPRPSPLGGERDGVRGESSSSYHYPKLAGEKWISLISAGLPLRRTRTKSFDDSLKGWFV